MSKVQKVAVFGDMHGHIGSFTRVLEMSKHNDYSRIVQVGDFGLWDHILKGVKFLDELNAELTRLGRRVYAIGGNHENWDHWNWYVENMPKDAYGFAILRTHIMLAPRVHHWNWYGKDFLAVAGAASIDKEFRLMDEAAGTPQQWWPQEQITDEEVAGIANRKVDYLMTHDASDKTPWGFRLIPDPDSEIHRRRIDTVLKKVRPEMHFHGHMHKKYDWVNMIPPIGEGDYHQTQTYGLDCNDGSNSWGILDTEAQEFNFHPYK